MKEYDEWSLTAHYEETDNCSDETLTTCIPCGGWGYDKEDGRKCPFCGGSGAVAE